MLAKLFSGIVLVALFAPAAVSAETGGGPAVGQPSPSILGRMLDEKYYRLKQDTGKPKVINFFWVNCIPCKKEMPELAILEKQHKEVKFISVHTEDEKIETIVKFLKTLPGAPSNIVMTSGGVKEAFKYNGLPHTIVLDSDNVVLMNLSGYTPENMRRLASALQQISKK
jgi:thiol-disulfide isomerase/thioredoxin